MLALDPRFEKIDRMDGFAFEAAVAELLDLLGYENVERQDRFEKGADIVAMKDDVRIAVQVKRWSGAVDLKSVRQLVDGMKRYDCDHGLLVTNSYLTDPAIECAREWEIELWDRQMLSEYVDGEASIVDTGACAHCGRSVSPGVAG